jgi:predicted DNA-binding protein (MmcQ/YjbR family)
MTLSDIQRYCLSKKNTTAEYIHEGILTFKLKNKVFCYCYTAGDPLKIILKCDPVMAPNLRAHSPEIKEGFKMNNNTWNTITLSPRLLPLFIEELIDHSYELIEEIAAKEAEIPVYRIPAPAVKKAAVTVV